MEPRTARLLHGAGGAASRAAVVDGPGGAPVTSTMTPEALATMLRGCVADGGQVRTSELDRRALGHDASHFLLTPAAIVAPRDAEEVARLLRATAAAGIGLTFRSGGTSLSGQAGTEGVLADVRRNFTGVEILDDGARVRVQPGVTVKQLNARLARYGRKFGPDPASEAACTIGGVVANNSSGMACGTVENSYRTLESVVVVLSVRHGHRHRCGRRGRQAPRPRTRPVRGAAEAARADPRQPGVGGEDHPAVLDEEHHGLRHQRAARLRQRCRRSSPT